MKQLLNAGGRGGFPLLKPDGFCCKKANHRHRARLVGGQLLCPGCKEACAVPHNVGHDQEFIVLGELR